ncbi:hypothetical protein evm_006036 [Chilo suppressalis]|nr:hypothetical protein evm_006036 [Chilo suppressalis]
MSRYDKDANCYCSKMNISRSKMRNTVNDRYAYPDHLPSRNNIENCHRSRMFDPRDSRNYDRDYAAERHYENDRRRFYDQKTSRSYDVHRDAYPEDEKYFRRTSRSDNVKDKLYDDREKYYDEKIDPLDTRDRYISGKDRRPKRNLDRCDRNSVVSRDDEFRDRYSERERDSGLSVADGDTSTVSGKSNYMRVVKQEIAEQRETMDKMMKLWKELMRCFKGLSTQNQNKSAQDSAANVQESAEAQLRLWRECMRRYETVARDVGDTDARLMEEINKQRSEMAEMASMWQECLQRYREMSSDFNNLKQQVNTTKQQYVAPESPTRQAPAAPLTCAEGETIPAVPYRLPNNYPPMPPPMGGGYGGGSPLRSRASAPPAWWWCGDARGSPRRRSSPDSRGSRDRDRDRDRRHRHKDRERGFFVCYIEDMDAQLSTSQDGDTFLSPKKIRPRVALSAPEKLWVRNV